MSSKTAYLLGAVLTGWTYIALVDYAIGMEVFRFLAVFVLATRNSKESVWGKIFISFRAFWANLLISIGFIFWRMFLFENQRQATDVGAQLGKFLTDPVSTGMHWFLQTYNSLLNLAILAWVDQFPRYVLGLRLRDVSIAFGFAALTGLLVTLAGRIIREENAKDVEAGLAAKDALFIGGIGMVLGILPVIMANRYINLGGFSHYALPASLASALFLTGVIHLWSSRSMQTSMIYAVIVFAALSHCGIAMNAANEERAIEKFWWQVNWRVPALQPGVLLVIQYPSENIGDDGNGVMEAPAMMYFPRPSGQIPVQYPLAALTLDDASLQDVLAGNANKETTYRSHFINYDYENILVLSQPTPTSCVHVLDGRRPLISQYDPVNVALAAPSSNIENVLVDAEPAIPQEFAFGSEPEHGWCYYFEKAELSLQRGEWDKAAQLGEKAIRLGFTPEDRSEWIPFLYAYAMTGNDLRLKQTSTKINSEKSLRLQACAMLSEIDALVTPEVREMTATLYCKSK